MDRVTTQIHSTLELRHFVPVCLSLGMRSPGFCFPATGGLSHIVGHNGLVTYSYLVRVKQMGNGAASNV